MRGLCQWRGDKIRRGFSSAPVACMLLNAEAGVRGSDQKMIGRKCPTTAEGKCYFTAGLHPDVDSLRAFVQTSDCLRCNDSGCNDVELTDSAHFVFGGIGKFEGSLDTLFLRRMIALKQKYPDNVHLLIGSREIDLLEAWIDFSMLNRYTDKNRQKLSRQDLEDVVKLGCSKIFKKVCDSHLFDDQHSLEGEGQETVQNSFLSKLEELKSCTRLIEEYLRLCRFAHYFGRTIFIHGCWNLSVCALFSNYMQTENTKGCFVDYLNSHFSDAIENLFSKAAALGDVEDELEYLRHAVRFCFKDIIPIDFFNILQFKNVVCSYSVLGFSPTIIQHEDVSILGLDTSASTHLLDEFHDINVPPESCCCSVSFTEDGCMSVSARAGSNIRIRFSKCTWSSGSGGEEQVQLGTKRDNLYIISKLSYCERQYYVYLCPSSLLVSLGMCSEEEADLLHCKHDEEEETGGDRENVLMVPGGGTVHLVGTAHVSSKSCDDVRRALQAIRPQEVPASASSSILTVRADRRRRAVRSSEGDAFPHPARVPHVCRYLVLSWPRAADVLLCCRRPSAIMSKMKEKDANLFSLLYSWFLSNVSTRLEVAPGEEFRVAYEESKKLSPPSAFLLIDRPVHITVSIAARACARESRLPNRLPGCGRGSQRGRS
eukprot:766332-Hanusia_phi.AAC.3